MSGFGRIESPDGRRACRNLTTTSIVFLLLSCAHFFKKFSTDLLTSAVSGPAANVNAVALSFDQVIKTLLGATGLSAHKYTSQIKRCTCTIHTSYSLTIHYLPSLLSISNSVRATFP